MRIVIDCRMYGLENAGIGRYIINLINQIEKIDQKNEYYLLLRKKYFLDLIFRNPKFHKILADYSHYSLKEQIFLPIQLFKLKPDLVHFPHFNIPLLYFGKFVVTIHDLIKHTSKGMATTTRSPWLYWLKYFGYKVIFGYAVRRSLSILVPSQFIKKNLIDGYRLEGDKIFVTYEGVSKSPNNSKIEVINKYRIIKPYLLYVGNLYPHKNIDRLIEAVRIVDQNSSIELVIVCSRNVFWERLKGKDHVKSLGFVPDEELKILYSQAKAFVFPTLSEGFGLPGLEAMETGCPVICSDIPMLREIYGDAAIYFNPLDINDIAKKIDTDPKGLDLVREKGYNQVTKYSWEKMAKETLNIYTLS
jgi:glycosyltransferase involved in cell wall biosynthesis